MVLLLGKIIFYLSPVPCFCAFAFSLGMGALYAKKQAKTAFRIEKIYRRNKFYLLKGILQDSLRSYIKSARVHARISQNNSQVNPRVIQRLFSVLYKTCLMSYIRVVFYLIEDPYNTHYFARVYNLLFVGYTIYARHLCKPALTQQKHIIWFHIIWFHIISFPIVCIHQP